MKKISIKKAIVILIIFALVGVGIVFALSRQQKKISYKTVEVGLGDITQTVSETGTVKAITELKLSFLGSGKIQRQNFKVGDSVKSGQLLAELDYAALVISKQEAQANYEVAVENLNKLLAGASGEERRLAEASVRQAESALASAKNELARTKNSLAENISQAEKNLRDLESSTGDTPTTQEQAVIAAETNLNNAKSSYGQTINNSRESALVAIADKLSLGSASLDAVNRILTDEDADDYLSLRNPAYLDMAKSSYKEGLGLLTKAQSSLTGARVGQNNPAVSKALDDTIAFLDSCVFALNNTFSALNNSVVSNKFSQAEIDANKATVNAQTASMNSAISIIKTNEQSFQNALTAYDNNIKSANDSVAQSKSAYSNAVTAAKNALASAKTSSSQQEESARSRVSAAEEALDVAKAQRDKALAGADSHDIALNKARIRQAQAAIDSISQQIENSQIKAPLDGLITEIHYKIGEQIVANQPLYSLLGNGEFDIEVLISEADINKVKVGDLADITLDAFGDELSFPGTVAFIEPAESVIQDVIYYKVDIKFEKLEAGIKPGMTANIVITTNKKSNVFSVPSRAIIDKGAEGNYVRLLVGEQEKEQKIITGLRGDGGDVEVLDGVKAGDLIITQVIEK